MTRPFPFLRRTLALGLVLATFCNPEAAAFQVTPYGSGVNPPGSLAVTSGTPVLGETFIVGVSNTASASAPASFAFLSIATTPDPAFPAGTVLPGFGLAFPGAPGELLISLTAPDTFVTLGPVAWAGGTAEPASFDLAVPFAPALSGLTIYLQGLLSPTVGVPSLGLTNGLAVTLSEPYFPELVPIQPGTFQIGSNAPPGLPYFGTSFEKPVHQVTISQPYWMGRYEVTQREYEALMGTNPSQQLGADRPVDSLTWFDAIAYCDALNARATALGKLPAGYEYRLPTEAEWEYACRAGTTTEFSFGDALFCDQARFEFSYHATSGGICPTPLGSVPVGSFPPNAWGLHDMHGNVLEWCMDNFGGYSDSPKTDPLGVSGPNKVLRGGSWEWNSDYCRSAFRTIGFPIFGFPDVGFRVVVAPVITL